MTSFEIFKPKCLCIILDVAGLWPAKDGQSAFVHIKHGLIQGLSTLEEDDLVYVYRAEGDLAMGKLVSESASIINDWHHRKINVSAAAEECVVLVSQYDHARRGVFYITDNYKPLYDGLLAGTIKDEMGTDSNCQIFSYGIGRAYGKSLGELGDGVNDHYRFRHVHDYTDLEAVFTEDLRQL